MNARATMIPTYLALLPLLLVVGLITTSQAAVSVVDMTYKFGSESVFWPGSPAFQFNIISRGNTSAGFWYESNSFFTAEHGGTHVDAPAHFAQGAWRVDDIPASNLVGPAAVIDVKAKVAADPDYLLSVQDVQDWEKAHGKLPPKSIVIMNSGWSSRYPDPAQVFNTPQPTNASTFHFPGFDPNLATFLTTERDIIAIGVDTPSTDHGQSSTFETHVVIGAVNVIGLENLANVDRLPARGAIVVVGIVKLEDGSGGPARILALVGDDIANVFGVGTGGVDSCVVAKVLVGWVVLLSYWFGRQRLV